MVTRAQKAAADALEKEPDSAVIDPAEEYTPDDIAVMTLLSELGETGVMVNIYRQGATVRDLELLDEMPLEDFTPMKLAYPPFNGGKFRIHARSKGGLVANRELKVMGKPVAVAPVAESTMTPQSIAQIVAQTLQVMLPQMMPKAPENPLATLEGIRAIGSMFKEMMPAPIAATPAKDGFSETISNMRAMAELSKVLNPVNRVKDENGATDVPGTLLERGMDLLANLASNAKGVPQPEPADIPLLANPAQPLPALQPSEIADMNLHALEMRFALKIACKAAANGETAEDFANRYYEDIPDAILQDMSNRADWFDELCKVHSVCREHEAWFTEVQECMMDFMKEDAAPEASPVDNASNLGQADDNSTSTKIDTPADGPSGTPLPAAGNATS